MTSEEIRERAVFPGCRRGVPWVLCVPVILSGGWQIHEFFGGVLDALVCHTPDFWTRRHIGC